jgi:hypothetical protein
MSLTEMWLTSIDCQKVALKARRRKGTLICERGLPLSENRCSYLAGMALKDKGIAQIRD